MDRTIRLMRRTLQCAVFACPLALLSPWLAAATQLIWTVHTALFLPVTAPLWKKRQDSPAALIGRALLPCAAALFLSGIPHYVLLLLFPRMHDLTHLLMHALTALSSILLQSVLQYHLPYFRREHVYIALACLLLFIVCMLSVG